MNKRLVSIVGSLKLARDPVYRCYTKDDVPLASDDGPLCKTTLKIKVCSIAVEC